MATSKAPNLTGVVPALSGPSDSIVPALERIDPFLRFLTKATGKTMVPLQMLQSVLPKSSSDADQNGDTSTAACCGVTADEILLELTHRGVLHYQADKQIVGFPLPPSADNSTSANKVSTSVSSVLPKPPSLIGKGLHGSSKAVAKRRMKVLMWSLGKEPSWICRMKEGSTESVDTKKKTATKNKNTERACTTSISAVKEDTTITISAPGDNSKKISLTHAQQLSLNSDNHNSEGTKQHATPDTEVNGDVAGESSDRTLAYRALHNLFSKNNENVTMSKPDSVETSYNSIDGEHKGEQQTKRHWLPCQAAFAGSHPGRESRYGTLSKETLDMIPVEVLDFFNLNIDSIRGSSYGENNEITEQINVVKTEYNTVGCTYAASSSKRKLYLHQAQAIEAAMTGVHTVVCTGTGSGKSLCFLLPVVAKALNSLKQKSADGNANLGSASILLFPTKALAQDQLTKINVLLESLASQSNGKRQLLRAGVIDGDTPHSERDTIASECQLILTNPDTLHAAILPNWRRPSYKQLLGCVSTVVIDEAHVYEGTFGAHVALVLSRLKRICCVASSEFTPLQVASESNSILPYTTTNSPKKACPFFIACSATMAHPEQHFRALCRIVDEESVCVLSPDDDGSPCGPKHYFVWNPPILGELSSMFV
jgi:DEAD/DEAH box helicase domain-containing protein